MPHGLPPRIHHLLQRAHGAPAVWRLRVWLADMPWRAHRAWQALRSITRKPHP